MRVRKLLSKSFLVFSLMILFCMGLPGCKADEDTVTKPVTDNRRQIAREALQDSIVFYARAMMGTVNKTLLEQGCPVKYYFSWKDDETMNVQIRHFTVGVMPLTISFSINLKFMELNTWEKKEYPGSGWVKFSGDKGVTIANANADGYEDDEGGNGFVTGYFNAETQEIEFATVFNMMNMSTDVYLQKIDYSRMATYDEDFAQFERDLAQYKEDHGL